MKKCHRCNVVYHLDARYRCLYCETVLHPVEEDDTMIFDARIDIHNMRSHLVALRSVLKDRTFDGVTRMEYLVTSYFRIRTFKFLYFFNRMEAVMGREWRRFFIQRLNVTFFFRLPWLFVNFLDSIYVRLIYNAHCEKCNCKFTKYFGREEHEPELCAYCKEYHDVIEDILNGNILKNEEQHLALAEERRKQGRKSAYYDLSASKKKSDVFWDIASIWVSMFVMMVLLARLFLPLFLWGVEQLEETQMYLL